MTDIFTPLTTRYSAREVAFLRAVLEGEEAFLTSEIVALAAEEVMHYFGRREIADLRRLRPMIFTRAWARLTAQKGTRPRAAEATKLCRDDVTLTKQDIPYSQFFAVEDSHLKHRRFAGGDTGVMMRAGFLMADAVTVLPYDPLRDRVLVIEQFRFGPYARGDVYPWMLEPIAGRVDAGEAPEATARREAVEEAGVTLETLHKVAEYYPSAGAMTEYVTSYVGIADLPDGLEGIGGLAHEHEDIASSLMSFDQLMALCDAGQLDVAPLYITALWLARHRDRLRAAG